MRRLAAANRRMRCLVLRMWAENCKCRGSLKESVKKSLQLPQPQGKEREEGEALKTHVRVI